MHISKNDSSSLRMFDERFDTAANLFQEACAESSSLEIVINRGLIQFKFGKAMK